MSAEPKEVVDAWFKKEVLTHKEDYPNLAILEERKAKWKWEHSNIGSPFDVTKEW